MNARRDLIVIAGDPDAPEPVPLGRTLVVVTLAQAVLVAGELGLITGLAVALWGWLPGVGVGIGAILVLLLRRRLRRFAREHQLSVRVRRKLNDLDEMLDDLQI